MLNQILFSPLLLAALLLLPRGALRAAGGAESVRMAMERLGGPEKHASALVTSESATIVLAVDEPTSMQARRWIHEVQEAGSYQIGVAWVDVDAQGEGVTVNVAVRGAVAKSVTAPANRTVTRFETRLEGLVAGDVIEVAAIPLGGSSYRIGFQVACGTPRFTGRTIFDVQAAGAAGDGKANDLPVIRKLIQAAHAAGGGIIRFDGSRKYYVEGSHCFALSRATNIRLDGHGATIVMHPAFEFAVIEQCENIEITGFTVTHHPLPYFQGHIVGYNIQPGKLSMDIVVPQRYPVPRTGAWLNRQFSRSFWEEPGLPRVGGSLHLYLDRIESLDAGGRRLRVWFRDDMKARLQTTKDNHATELVVPERDFGQRSDQGLGFCVVQDSGRVTVSNVLVHSYCNMGFTPRDNWGPVTFSDVDIRTPSPATELFAGWRDGWHVHGNRFGILIENGTFDGGLMYDDLFSPYLVLANVREATGNGVRLQNGRMGSWRPGDWISFWDKDQGRRVGMARIAGMEGRRDLLVLDRTLDLKAAHYALNEETFNRGMVIRGCRTTPVGKAATVRLRCPVQFQNCRFDNIHFWIYSGQDRPRPRGVVFEDTRIWDRLTLNVDNAWDVTFRRCTLDKTILELDNVPNALVEDVQWVHSTQDIVRLENNSSLRISGRTTRNGQSSLAPWIRASGSAVRYEGIVDSPRGANPHE
jgi:hypothetical protein